jgi:hypothetical protein
MVEVFKDTDKISWVEKTSFILASLFFILSPINYYGFQNSLLSNNQTLVYPLFFYIFLRFLKTNNYKYIIFIILVCFVFSVNFSINVFPWFLAFFGFTGIFILFYSVIENKSLILLKGSVLFLFLFILTQFFQLMPQTYGIMDSSNLYNKMISGKINVGTQYFESILPYVKLSYNLGNQDQYIVSDIFNHGNKVLIYEYGAKFLFIFFIYPIIIIFGVLNLKKNKDLKSTKKYLLIFALFIVLLFFMTANIGYLGVDLYRKLFIIPGFSMFRSYYTKFNFVFTFFYAMLFGYSLIIVDRNIKLKILKFLLPVIVFILIIFNAWPFLSGSAMNVYRTDTDKVKPVFEMDSNYINFLYLIKNKKLDEKYLSFPLTDENYVVLKGMDGGAYVGNSMIGVISGKNDFVGLDSFSILRDSVVKILKDKDSVKLKHLESILNIGNVIYNSDNYIYDKFGNPYLVEMKYIFPNQKSIYNFISKLSLKNSFNIETYRLYSNKEYFMPHLYTPLMTITTRQGQETLLSIISQRNYIIRSAIYFNSADRAGSTANTSTISSAPIFNPKELTTESVSNTPVIEFKKINPTKYRVIIHHAISDFPLVFSESFNDGWKDYLVDYKPAPVNFKAADYKILDGNADDQASATEVQGFMSRGDISSLGDGKDKNIAHTKWADNKEAFDYNESYKIDFISKNFQDTIQNDNLADGHFYETWFKTPVDGNLNHQMVNGYANSWDIDPQAICLNNPKCVKNADGSYDLELVIEFWPQRLFYIGLFISGTTLVGCLGYLGWDFVKRKKKALENKKEEKAAE